MTIEARIPLNELMKALEWYDSLYDEVHDPKIAYKYKMRLAKRTILSVLLNLIAIGLFIASIFLAVNNSTFAIIPVILGVYILLNFFYLEKIPNKKRRKLRFRLVHYIICIFRDVYEFSIFKKKFGLSTPAFLLIFGVGKKQAFENIEDWGYYNAQEELEKIKGYKKKYSSYRDYVDLGQYWHIADELLGLLESGRAYDMASALAVIDFKKYQERMEELAQNAIDRAVEAEERVARAQAAAAEAEKRFWDNANDKLS